MEKDLASKDLGFRLPVELSQRMRRDLGLEGLEVSGLGI